MQDNKSMCDDYAENVTDGTGASALDATVGTTGISGNPTVKKPTDQTASKPENQDKPEPKKPVKKSEELGKGMTLEQMEAKRDGLKDEAKNWTDAIGRRKRAERLKEEKAKREKEQRDALEFYRKYRPHIEMSKRLKLTSGRTAFEWIESELAKGGEGM